MLNQCIFIGRISEITFYAKNQVIVKIKITNQNGMSDTFVSIDMSGLLVAKDQLKKDQLIAVKAKVESEDGNIYTFQAERITILGGQMDA